MDVRVCPPKAKRHSSLSLSFMFSSAYHITMVNGRQLVYTLSVKTVSKCQCWSSWSASHISQFSLGGCAISGIYPKRHDDRSHTLYILYDKPPGRIGPCIGHRMPAAIPHAGRTELEGDVRRACDEQARRSSDRSDVTGERLEARRTSVPRPVHTACVRPDRRRCVSRVYTLPYVSWSVKPYAVKPYGAFNFFAYSTPVPYIHR